MHNWKHFYKHKQGLAVANMLYQPLVNEDNTVFCMNWNPNDYFENESMNEELYNFWFDQEVMYLSKIERHKIYSRIIRH